MVFPDSNVKSPVLSPSLNEFGNALLTDEGGNVLELFAAVPIDALGHSNLGSAVVSPGKTSHVTGKKQSAVVTCPGGEKIRLVGLVGLDSSGNPVPFKAAQAVVATGKFQSTVQTGTGSSQNVAHGLAVVPSLVLIAAYDNTASGSTPFTFQIVEGVHDATNVKVTATSGLKFKVIAFA